MTEEELIARAKADHAALRGKEVLVETAHIGNGYDVLYREFNPPLEVTIGDKEPGCSYYAKDGVLDTDYFATARGDTRLSEREYVSWIYGPSYYADGRIENVVGAASNQFLLLGDYLTATQCKDWATLIQVTDDEGQCLAKLVNIRSLPFSPEWFPVSVHGYHQRANVPPGVPLSMKGATTRWSAILCENGAVTLHESKDKRDAFLRGDQ